ncbi:MAG: hypothetical protein HOO91_17260 [Bacteroidales bacterium]|nr:hypothetical protein [Bacteroidales bacterium]
MIDNKNCERTAKCPVYLGILISNGIIIQTYRKLFCESGSDGKNMCRRYQVAKIMGVCPQNILPNTHLTVDEIVEKMKAKGLKPVSDGATVQFEK